MENHTLAVPAEAGSLAEPLTAYKTEALRQFCPNDAVLELRRYGSGHIHDTFLASVRGTGGAERKLILQRINKVAFREPEKLTENIAAVTAYLRERIREQGGDPDRETLTFLTARDGRPYYRDPSGEYWRCSRNIDGTSVFDEVGDVNIFARSGAAFGRFDRLMAGYPAEALYESIQGFHDTAARLEVFRKAVSEDLLGRADGVRDEIDFYLSHEALAHVYDDALRVGTIKLRVTHNDTKLNNVLFDGMTGLPVCVIDLDTVMPGLVMNDFGDAVRYGCNRAGEEADPAEVHFDVDLFRAFAGGFREGCGSSLSPEEIRLLPAGAMVMTYECGLRFLTDYLQGDVYFRVKRPGQNLNRSRTQIALLKDMERRREEMNRIISSF